MHVTLSEKSDFVVAETTGGWSEGGVDMTVPVPMTHDAVVALAQQNLAAIAARKAEVTGRSAPEAAVHARVLGGSAMNLAQ